MEFKIDYGTLKLGPGEDHSPLYAVINGRIATLGGDEAMFHDPVTDRSHVMTTQVLAAMDLCRDFQTMEQHVKRVCERLPNMRGQETQVRRVLDSLATRGLLISDDAYLIRLQQSAASEPAPLLGGFIRACDRPQRLQTLVTSLREQPADLGLLGAVLVVDDSREEAAVAAHADCLRELAGAAAVAAFHITPALRQQWSQQLQAELPEQAAVIAQLIEGERPRSERAGSGSGRNLITLLAAGQRYALFDDDFVWPLHRHPEASDQLAVGEHLAANRSYPDQAAAMAAGQHDPAALATQLAICGRRFGDLLNGRAARLAFGRQQLRGLAPSRDSVLQADARLVMTVNGHRGGCGAGGLDWMLLFDRKARQGFAPDDAAYLERRADPAVWFGSAIFRPSRIAAFTPFLVDNSQLMPCVTPFGRGEDAVYNALVALGDSSALQLHVPWAIGHLPGELRDRSGTLARANTPDINQCLAEFISHVASDVYATSVATRYGLMAARLDDLAQGSEQALVSYLREYLAYRRSSFIQNAQAALKDAADAPAAWRSDVLKQIEANGRAIIDRGVPRFGGWPKQLDNAGCVAAFRREAGLLAAGLRLWPSLWELALQRRHDWLQQARVSA